MAAVTKPGAIAGLGNIDPSFIKTFDLRLLVLFQEGSGAASAVFPQKQSTVAGTPDWVSEEEGAAVNTVQSSSTVGEGFYFDGVLDGSTAQTFTVISRFKPKGAPGFRGGAIFVHTSTNQSAGIGVGHDTAGFAVPIVRDTNGVTVPNGGAAASKISAEDYTDRWVTAGANYSEEADGVTKSGRFYVNGLRVAATSWSHIGSYTAGNACDRVHLGLTNFVGVGTRIPFNGSIAWGAVFGRVLTDEEHLALYQMGFPYCLISRPKLWLVPAAGGAFTLASAVGAFTLTGVAAGLKAARNIAAAPAAFTLTGNAASLRSGKNLAPAAGAFTLTGVAAALRAARQLAVAPGSFVMAGQDATLTYVPASGSYSLASAAGAFTLTGQDAVLRAARKLVSSAGAFTLTGNAATLTTALSMLADAGVFALTGQDVLFEVARRLQADPGAFTVAGQNALFIAGEQYSFADTELITVPWVQRTIVVAFEERTVYAQPRNDPFISDEDRTMVARNRRSN